MALHRTTTSTLAQGVTNGQGHPAACGQIEPSWWGISHATTEQPVELGIVTLLLATRKTVDDRRPHFIEALLTPPGAEAKPRNRHLHDARGV
jgi:hypothetical protein